MRDGAPFLPPARCPPRINRDAVPHAPTYLKGCPVDVGGEKPSSGLPLGLSRHFLEIFWEFCLCISLSPRERQHIDDFDLEMFPRRIANACLLLVLSSEETTFATLALVGGISAPNKKITLTSPLYYFPMKPTFHPPALSCSWKEETIRNAGQVGVSQTSRDHTESPLASQFLLGLPTWEVPQTSLEVTGPPQMQTPLPESWHPRSPPFKICLQAS